MIFDNNTRHLVFLLLYYIDMSILSCYTESMKTAISIPDDVFREIEAYVREHNCSRSEVFLMAVREFLDRVKSEKMLEELNKVYAEEESKEERDLLRKTKERFRDTILEE